MVALKQDAQVAKVFSEMESRVRPAQRPEEVIKKLPKYIDQRSDAQMKPLIPIIESLAGEYPHSEAGRWAFQKIQSLLCSKHGKYVIAQSLVIRLASNTNLDEGLKYYLIEVTKGPMRLSSGRVVVLNPMERINFLMQLRFWNESRRLLEDQLAALEGSTTLEGKRSQAYAMYSLATVLSKQNDIENAVKTWSRYLELFSDIADWRAAYEGLADTLSKARVYHAAAQMYEVLAKSPSADPILRWHHFWNLYLGGQYSQALQLLDRGGYVPQRDRGIDGGLDYWRAKIMEKMGRTNESNELQQKIISEYGSSYYAMLVQAKKPKIAESSVVSLFKDNEISTSDVSGQIPEKTADQANQQKEEVIDEVVNSDYKITLAMKKWGLNQFGRRLYRALPFKVKSANSGWADTFKVAFELKDFSYGLKSASVPGSPLQKIPNALAQFESHIVKYNVEWRKLYPFAYKEIVESMANAAEVDPFLIVSLMRAESIYDPDARSLVGARGLMQIMPFTGVRIARTMGDSRFAVSELHKPEINIGYAAYYIKKLKNYYRGNEVLAVAAYNGGPSSVDRWLGVYGNLELDEFVESIPFRETRRYVKSVIKNYDQYKRIWQKSKALAELPPLPKATTGEEIF
jgi:soluble lytic murein transglycosylase